jgi:hypothetical protein
MIGDGTADDAAANNNDLGPGWEFSFIYHTGFSMEFLFPPVVGTSIEISIDQGK